MSCLTAPPLVSLLSLSRVQSQINSRLSPTLTYPSTRLHLQLAPRLCLSPTPRRSRWQQPHMRGRGPRGLTRAAAAAPDVAPLCPRLSARSRERGPVLPDSRSTVLGAGAQHRSPAAVLQNLGPQLLITTTTTKPAPKNRQNGSVKCKKRRSFSLALKLL